MGLSNSESTSTDHNSVNKRIDPAWGNPRKESIGLTCMLDKQWTLSSCNSNHKTVYDVYEIGSLNVGSTAAGLVM